MIGFIIHRLRTACWTIFYRTAGRSLFHRLGKGVGFEGWIDIPQKGGKIIIGDQAHICRLVEFSVPNGGELIVTFGVHAIGGTLGAVKPPPGQPQKDASYVMNEGERQDEITVLKIDNKAGVVTFDNHGTVQELSLVPATSSSGYPAPPGAPRGGMPGMNNPALRAAPSGGASVLPAMGAASATGPGGRKVRTGGNASQASSTATSASSIRGNGQPAQPETLSPEAQIIMMESQRAKWLDQGNPAAAIIPPTPITKDLTGETGSGAGGPPAPGQ